jgi:hypothetical protein
MPVSYSVYLSTKENNGNIRTKLYFQIPRRRKKVVKVTQTYKQYDIIKKIMEGAFGYPPFYRVG